ncbi:unnamed protein product [Phaedon cochleariae]|uniref:Thyroglobulin type-1 domain-containing protein n=1 Tax=Phaedon cochleariae TaxID=80249 RepID=A0A9P0D8M6_PHACE|nr:unnamed protein product [Phaedon cochleariae]
MILLVIFFTISTSVFGDESILCSPSVCDGVKCPTLPEKCNIQNATHSGTFLPSPEACNCCQYCLENLNEGDECSIGYPSAPTPTSICGPGLACKLTNGNLYDGICSRMNTPCTQLQDDYDERRKNGPNLGSMEVRQTCTDEGEFASYKCIPGQTCYCVDIDGTRIFGESDFTSLPEMQMQCKCSRDYQQAKQLFGRELNPSEHFRCSSKGDYDTIQCMREQCLCTDATDGAPTYPNDPMVNIRNISNQTLGCYKGDTVGIYLKKCEEEYITILNETETQKMKNNYNMILGYTFPSCDIDGTYKAVQENSTHKYCMDKEGNILTALSKVDNKTLADSMDCKCLRALSVMTTNEKPSCLENGNYTPMQCRRGSCRCVDGNGNQVCKATPCEVNEIDKDTLKC